MIKLEFSDTRYGEITFDRDKIAVDDTLWTPILLSLFGGNIDADTQEQRQPVGSENKDWFGNLYILQTGLDRYNSSFERTLARKSFSSAGFGEYERAVYDDLDWLVKAKIIGTISVAFAITSPISISVTITVEKPSGVPSTYEFLWRKK